MSVHIFYNFSNLDIHLSASCSLLLSVACFVFSLLYDHHLLDLSAFANKLTQASLVHFYASLNHANQGVLLFFFTVTASIYKTPCSSGGNFLLVFCQSCRSLFRHVRACAAASRLLIVPARRLSSFETGTMPVCAYFLQFLEFGHSFQCLLLLPSFVCCVFCFFTTLRPSLI